MYREELYAQVRRSVFVEGISEREAASLFGIARETVRKIVRYATQPGYQRSKPVKRPKLRPYTGIIDQILAGDRDQPRKQRHTAKRIGSPGRSQGDGRPARPFRRRQPERLHTSQPESPLGGGEAVRERLCGR
ncbi:MAG: hypothetical protein O2795_05295 [Acidobacteria bacterium]|nr:hypothetical protein [Acidobacteriota bacterium]